LIKMHHCDISHREASFSPFEPTSKSFLLGLARPLFSSPITKLTTLGNPSTEHVKNSSKKACGSPIP
jgi:hypothetical protein